MKKKDMRIVTIRGYATNTKQFVEFGLSLTEISEIIKKLKDNKSQIADIHYKEHIIAITYNNLKKIYKTGKQMYTKVNLPKSLREYLEVLDLKKYNKRILGRDEELERAFTCLQLKDKSNAIFIGESGVGKTTCALEISRIIQAQEGPDDLMFMQIIKVDTTKLLRLAESSKIRIRYILQKMLDFFEENANKIIIYIDDLMDIMYSIELFKLFRSIFIYTNLKIISCISYSDFNEYFLYDEKLLKNLNFILIEEPEIEDLSEILKLKIKTLQNKYKVNISDKMINFAIFTGYHLSSSYSCNPESTVDTISFALADAKKKGQKEVIKQNIISYYYMDFKLAKKTIESEKLITAYHETGHYMVAKMSENIKNFKNAFVSILPIEGALGLTTSYDDLGKQLTYNKKYYLDIIAYYLAGRAGEELITKEYSSGASQDLIEANEVAERVLMTMGLSEREEEQNKNYFVGNYVKDYLLTDEIKTQINKEISKLMSEAYQRAKQIINDNIETFNYIVKKLLEEGILIGEELDEICEKFSKTNS